MPLFAVVAALVVIAAAPQPSKADHLVVLVFDAMRPDYVDRFGLPNFKRLRGLSREYVNGYVGHMASETVVSHLVLTTGKLPKQLPWQDEIYIDHAGALGPKGAVHETGTFTGEQFQTLMKRLPEGTFITARMKKAHGGKVFSVAQKHYTAHIFGTPAADTVITMKKADGKCTPSGLAVPAYIAQNDRYTVDCTKDYGTKTSFYPLDGARSVPGDDPAHQGGDVWVADIGLELMSKEKDWSVLLLSFSGIDKVAHMAAEHEGPRHNSFQTPYTLEKVARIADEQLGKILDGLERTKLLQRTVLVVTADHGGQVNTSYFGAAKTGKVGLRDGAAVEVVSPWLHRLKTLANVKALFADSAVRVWLEGDAPDNRAQAIAVLNELSGVVEVYGLTPGNDAYTRLHSRADREPAAFQKWAAAHNQELVDSMATLGAPDLIGLLADGSGYDMLGDHGGAQEKVQRIPIFVVAPGVAKGKATAPTRLVDIVGIISPALGL